MRFWISKNSEVPVREQLARQVMLAILSEDLSAGEKLPSVRTIARQHQLHPNTVSAAFHDLLEQGWLELRRGSGLYVRAKPPDSGDGELEGLLAKVLQEAGRRGYEPEGVLQLLERLIHPRAFEHVLIAEPDEAMFEILKIELADHVKVPIEALGALEGLPEEGLRRCVVVALPTRFAKLRGQLPEGVATVALRLRSARGALEGQAKPGPQSVVTIVSRSKEIRYWSRAMLIAVGFDPDQLSEIDATADGWQRRLMARAFVVTDAFSARALPAGCEAKIFRVVADSSLAELKRYRWREEAETSGLSREER